MGRPQVVDATSTGGATHGQDLVVFTTEAVDRVRQYMAQDGRGGLRLRVQASKQGGGKWSYRVLLEDRKPRRRDTVIRVGEADGGPPFDVLLDAESARDLAGSTIGYVDTTRAQGFAIRNPGDPRSCDC